MQCVSVSSVTLTMTAFSTKKTNQIKTKPVCFSLPLATYSQIFTSMTTSDPMLTPFKTLHFSGVFIKLLYCFLLCPPFSLSIYICILIRSCLIKKAIFSLSNFPERRNFSFNISQGRFSEKFFFERELHNFWHHLGYSTFSFPILYHMNSVHFS